jgi:hypothetical protein
MEGAEDATRTPADVTRARRAEVAWQLKLKPDFRAHRAPHGRGPGRY